MKRNFAGVGLALFGILSLAATGASAAGKDPFVGTWVLNAAKSDFGGKPGLANAKVTISAAKGGYKSVTDGTYADGSKVHAEMSGRADGSPIAVTGSRIMDSATLLHPDRKTLLRTERQGGKLSGISTLTVSDDGKTLTGVRRVIGTSGTQPTSTTVWGRAKH